MISTHMPTPMTPPPPPKDMFEPTEQSPNDFKAIDIQAVNIQMEKFLEYISETKQDFTSEPGSKEWILDVEKKLQDALSAIRDFQIAHAEDAVPKRNAFGRFTDIVLREQAPKDFDSVIKKYIDASNAFQKYFEKERKILLQKKEFNV